MHDSKTPVLVGAITVAANVLLSIALVLGLHFPIWGLALSMAITDSVYAAILLGFLYFRVHHMTFTELVLPAAKMFTAALLTGVCLYVPMKLLDQLVFDTTRTLPLVMLTGVASAIGLSVYLFLTWLLDIHELESFLALFGRAKRLLFAAEETVSDVIAEVTPTVSDSPNKLD
jgi:putative peptidoglycan lipid II flippase